MTHTDHFQRHRLILNMINHLGPVSRTDLIQQTAFRPATVGSIVNELIDQKLVVETGYQSSGQGRKRILLDINKSHLCAIGIFFSPGKAGFILSQFDGTIISQTQLQMSGPRKDRADRIIAHTQELLQEHQDKFFAGIGICKPLMDPTVYRIPDQKEDAKNRWINEDLALRLEGTTGLHTQVFSGVTLPAQAEHLFGAAKGINDFIWVELSNGIGTSLFSGGNAIGGAAGMAGELGHTLVSDGKDTLCYCGKPGCVEGAFGWPALQKAITQSLQAGVITCLEVSDGEVVSVADIRAALDAGDRMCQYHVTRCAEALGQAISNAVNLLNPAMIILYGFMLDLGSHFLEPLERSLRKHTLPTLNDFTIQISTSSEAIMPLGAVANIFSSYLRTDDYRWVYSL